MSVNNMRSPLIQPTITAGAYSAGDVVGGLITVPCGYGCTIRAIRIADDDNEKAVLDLYIFNDEPTTIADNAAFATAMTISDLKKHVKKVSFAAADYSTINSNAWARQEGLNIDMQTGKGNFYVYAVCTGTPTFTATSDLSFIFDLWVEG